MPMLTLLVGLLILNLSVNNFLGLWLSMELFTCILVTWLPLNEGKLGKSSIFLYFLTQFIASLGILVGTLSFSNPVGALMLSSSLLLKVSCYPLHGWLMKVIPHVSWEKVIVLLTLAKVSPLIMLTMITMLPPIIAWVLVLGMVPAQGAYLSSNPRTIMGFSSVAHTSWLVFCSLMSKDLLILYFSIYMISVLPICFYLKNSKNFTFKKVISWKSNPTDYILMMLSLSGIPPFIGFIPKLIVILFLLNEEAYVEAFTLSLLSMIPMYLYFKMAVCALSSKKYKAFGFSASSIYFSIIMMVVNFYLFWIMINLSSSFK